MVVDENEHKSSLQQSHTLHEMNSLNTEKTSRNTLQIKNLNVVLTRLAIDGELKKNGGSISAGLVAATESPLRRKLLKRCALNGAHHPSRQHDGAATSKSRQHNALKTSSRSNCRCFGRPMVCSVCLKRFVSSAHDLTVSRVCTEETDKYRTVSTSCTACSNYQRVAVDPLFEMPTVLKIISIVTGQVRHSVMRKRILWLNC